MIANSLQPSALSHQLLLSSMPPPDSYQAMGWLLLALAGLIGVALGAAQLYKTVQDIRRSNDPQSVRVTNPTQRREVTFPPEFTTVDECRQFRAAELKLTEELRGEIMTRDHAGIASREKIHNQLTRIETDIATLTERSRNTDGWLEKVDSKLSDVAEGLANVAGRIK